jgi:uncharacterized membrane protein
MLVGFPIGLLTTGFIFDLVYLASPNPRWVDVAFWMITAGIVGGLLAAPFGAIDWLAIPRGTRAHRVGLLHGAGNLVVVALFAASWWLRHRSIDATPGGAIALAGIAVGLALVTSWLGGELVDRLGVGVSNEANLNAPSSLAGPPSDTTRVMPPQPGPIHHPAA